MAADFKSELSQQLEEERDMEVFTERRVQLLKAQNMQLERQVMLLQEAHDYQSAALNDVHIALAQLQTTLSQPEVSGKPTTQARLWKALRQQIDEAERKCSAAQQKPLDTPVWVRSSPNATNKLPETIPSSVQHELSALAVQLDNELRTKPQGGSPTLRRQVQRCLWELEACGTSIKGRSAGTKDTARTFPGNDTLARLEALLKDQSVRKAALRRLCTRLRQEQRAWESHLALLQL